MQVRFWQPGAGAEHLKHFYTTRVAPTEGDSGGGGACGAGLGGEASHLCIRDLYKVRLQLRGSGGGEGEEGGEGGGRGGGAFQLHFRVSGPQKDYESDTVYSRL